MSDSPSSPRASRKARFWGKALLAFWILLIACFMFSGGPNTSAALRRRFGDLSNPSKAAQRISLEEYLKTGKRPSGAVDSGAVPALAPPAYTTKADNLRSFAEFLSRQESRFTGYPGNEASAEYIAAQFREIFGEKNTSIEERTSTVPHESFTRLTLLGQAPETFEKGLNALHPFQVKLHTFPGGQAEGQLVYGGKGELESLDGKDLSGAIVLLDFDSSDRYLTLRSLGAKAFIFLQRGHVTYQESVAKEPNVPIDAPCFCADAALSERLLRAAQEGQRGRIETQSEWQEVRSRNILGVFEGAEGAIPGVKAGKYTRQRWNDNVIVISAFYDAPSIVPARAPGRTNAPGIMALLEIARAIRAEREAGRPNMHRVVFLANSGHFQDFEGIIDFLSRHARKQPGYRKLIPEQDRLDPRAIFSLEMTDSDPRVLVAQIGNGMFPRWDSWSEMQRETYAPCFQKVAQTFQKACANAFGAEGGVRIVDGALPSDRNYRSFFPVASPVYDSDVCTYLGTPGIALTTPDDPRTQVNTPVDTMDQLNVENVAAQIQSLQAAFSAMSRDGLFFDRANLIEREDQGVDAAGRASWYDLKTSFFVPAGRMEGAVAVCTRQGANRGGPVNNLWGVRPLRFQKLRFNAPREGNEKRGYEVNLTDKEGWRIALSRLGVGAIEGVAPETAGALQLEAVVRMADGSQRSFKFQGSESEYRTVLPPDARHLVSVSLELAGGARRVLFGDLPIQAGAHTEKSGDFALEMARMRWAKLRFWDKKLPPGTKAYAQISYRGPQKIPVDLAYDPLAGAFECEVDSGSLGIAAIHAVRENGKKKTCYTNIAFEDRYEFRTMNCAQHVGMEVDVYKLNQDGAIVFAPDQGRQGAQSYPNWTSRVYGETWESLAVSFPCKAATVLDTMDPRYLAALDISVPLSESDAEPERWGQALQRERSRFGGLTPLAMTSFLDPGARLKMLMSTGLFGIKLLLINAPDSYIDRKYLDTPLPAEIETAKFKGYEIENGGVLFNPAYQVARDIWVLDESRMRKLQRFGIKNARLESLHRAAFETLVEAKEFLGQKKWSAHLAAAHKAWGLETRAYPDVRATAVDTVKAVVFYFALLLPFSFFMERLLFGFTDFRKQIGGFWAIFFLAFLLLRFVHPAFKISSSPYVIFLAFVILCLGAMVAFAVSVKCASEIRKMKAEAAGIFETDIGRLAATSSALTLGVSNLRKRRTRTTLTALTLVLLTFSVLSFTSVSTSLQFWKIPVWDFSPYQGALLRGRDCGALAESLVREVKRSWSGKAQVVPRAWKIFDINYPELCFWKIERDGGKATYANAFLGLAPEESQVPQGVAGGNLPQKGLITDALLPGSRWFTKDEADADAIILPDFLAQELGIAPEEVAAGRANVRMFHQDLRVVGIFDSEKMNRFRTLDKEQITPLNLSAVGDEFRQLFEGVNPTEMGGEAVAALQRLSARTVAILPYETSLRYGCDTRALAIHQFKPGLDPTKEVEDFLRRSSVLMFYGDGKKVASYSSVGTTTFSSFGALFIPILIAAAIVFNTMLGAVYERTREIGIFCSIGLAPNHIGALFLAESFVFATVAAVFGYLLSQAMAFFLSTAGLLGAVNLNYSSLSAVAATLVVMATVVLSTLYPSRKASQMAVPDVQRKWSLEPPRGDVWDFMFPFTIGAFDAPGLNVFLYDYFKASSDSSAGRFFARGAKLEQVADFEGRGAGYRLTFDAWLAPYDMSISQRVTLQSIPMGKHGVFEVAVSIQRLSGEASSWVRMNREFLNALRKRFLVWRTMPGGLKQRFGERVGEGGDL